MAHFKTNKTTYDLSKNLWADMDRAGTGALQRWLLKIALLSMQIYGPGVDVLNQVDEVDN